MSVMKEKIFYKNDLSIRLHESQRIPFLKIKSLKIFSLGKMYTLRQMYEIYEIKNFIYMFGITFTNVNFLI